MMWANELRAVLMTLVLAAACFGVGGIGLMPLALGPLGLIGARRDAFLQKFALFAFLLATAWFLTDQESRFLIDVYAIAAILSVLGWRYAANTAPTRGPALSAVVLACSLLYGGFMIVKERTVDMHAAYSSTYAAQRRSETIPFVRGFDYLNSSPAVRTVLILDPSVPPYYLEKPYIKPFGQWGEQTLPGHPNLEEVLSQIHSLGVSHLLDVRSSVSDFRVAETQPSLKLVLSEPDVRVYAVE